MSNELVAPAATETPQVPENTAPGPDATDGANPSEPKADRSPEDKEREYMRRRTTKLERTNARMYQENEQYRQRLEALERSQPQQKSDPIQVDPREVQNYVETRAEAIASQRELTKTVNGVVSKGNERFKDFDDATGVLAQEIPFYTRTGQPTPQLAAILEADDPPALIHYLGSNPDVAAELSDLTPSQLTRRLIKLEGELKQPTRQPSSAPKPLEPVKASGSKGEPDPAKDREGWIKWRNEHAKR